MKIPNSKADRFDSPLYECWVLFKTACILRTLTLLSIKVNSSSLQWSKWRSRYVSFFVFVFWASRHKGIGHDDLLLPDVGSEELLLAEDTAPDDIWVAFVKNCLSLCLVSDGKWTFSLVFAKPCHPLISVCGISLKEKKNNKQKSQKAVCQLVGKASSCGCGTVITRQGTSGGAKKSNKKAIELTLFTPGEGGHICPPDACKYTYERVESANWVGGLS